MGASWIIIQNIILINHHQIILFVNFMNHRYNVPTLWENCISMNKREDYHCKVLPSKFLLCQKMYSFIRVLINICFQFLVDAIFAVKDGPSSREGSLLLWQDDNWGTFCQPFDLFTARAVCNTMLNTTDM